MKIIATTTDATIVCGFPGIGKSSVFKGREDRIADSDSSTFDKAGFPANYLAHIQKLLPVKQYILVSSHQAVRDALRAEPLPFTVVYPDRSLKAEYMERYRERGSPTPFLELLDKQWDNFIDGCELEADRIVLTAGQYLADVLDLSPKA